MSPSPSRPLQLGSVVWAELEELNGYRKIRSGEVVALSPPYATCYNDQSKGLLKRS